MLTGCPTCTKVGEDGVSSPTPSGPLDRVTASTAHDRPATVRHSSSSPARASGSSPGLFGVGGGFVIVPALALGLKLPMPEAIGTSLLVIAINSAVALSTRLATTTIDWDITLPFAVAAIAGVLSGGKVADRLDPKRSLRWFAGLLVAVAAYTAIRATAALVG